MARIAGSMLLFGAATLAWMIDAVSTTFEVNPWVLLPILVVGAGLLSVDVPGVRDFFRDR